MFAATMYLSVHPSVLLSATICYCVETAEPIVDIHLLRDSPINMVFCDWSVLRISDGSPLTEAYKQAYSIEIWVFNKRFASFDYDYGVINNADDVLLIFMCDQQGGDTLHLILRYTLFSSPLVYLTWQFERRANSEYFLPLSVRYFVIADGCRSCRHQGRIHVPSF